MSTLQCMQLRLSEGVEPDEKRLGYRDALARAYVRSRQPGEAVPHLQALLAAAGTPQERLTLLCRLADAEVHSINSAFREMSMIKARDKALLRSHWPGYSPAVRRVWLQGSSCCLQLAI